MVNDLTKDIEMYDQMRDELEARDMGKWILIYDKVLVNKFASFEEAAAEAVSRFGKGPYLIRRVGFPPMTLPASVMYRLQHA